jgi:hypothetical protein
MRARINRAVAHLLFQGIFQQTRVRSVTRQSAHHKANVSHAQQQRAQNCTNRAPFAHINKIPPISGDGLRHADSNAVTGPIPLRAK